MFVAMRCFSRYICNDSQLAEVLSVNAMTQYRQQRAGNQLVGGYTGIKWCQIPMYDESGFSHAHRHVVAVRVVCWPGRL